MTVDPAINFMVFDMLQRILSLADKPDQLGTYITSQMRELVGAKTVVLLRHNADGGAEHHTLIGVCPQRRRGGSEVRLVERIADISHDVHEPQIVRHEERTDEIGELLKDFGTGTSIIVPLEYGTTRVGLLMMVDILDTNNIESVIASLHALSGVLALELRNAGFYLALEHTVEERTRALRASEQALRIKDWAIESAITPVAISDLHERLTYVNPAFLGTWRYGSAEEVVGKTVHEFWQLGERSAEVVEALRTKGSWIGELTAKRKDGTTFDAQIAASMVVDEHKNPVCMHASFADITERKINERILSDVQRRESLGVLTSGIAHDFNNLLGTMMGNISLAQTRIPPEHPAAANIEKALSAMEHAANLTKQMLAYSGKGKFQNRTIDVTEVVREHISLMNVSLPKNVRFETHLAPDPVYIDGDPGQIEQIVMNLIINGGDAIGDRQGVVSVEVSQVHMTPDALAPFGILTGVSLKPGYYALLCVTDNGCGMSAETRTRIFDPFFTTKFTGRGLGLSAVLGIIRSHDGGIAIESTEGAGTTFRVLLPILHNPASAAVPAEAPPRDAEHETTQAKPLVLIIDDEHEIATMAQEMLTTGGYATLVEVNPVRALELYTERRTDIGMVLLDLTMPEMSGKEVVEALRAINPGVKIMISSGYTEDDVMKRLSTATVSGFIQKPYRLQSLLAMTKRIVCEDR